MALSRACHKEGGDASGAPTLSLLTTLAREPLFVRHSLFSLLPPRPRHTWQGLLKKKSAIREQHIQYPPRVKKQTIRLFFEKLYYLVNRKPGLLLDVSTPQDPELHLEVSTLQRPFLHLDVHVYIVGA